MSQDFMADIRAFSEKAKRNAGLVVRGSAQDVAELMSVPRDGLVRGAPFQEGVVPVDEGHLIGSLTVQINGLGVAQGSQGAAPSYTAALAGMKIGDEVQVAFTAPYARRIEYGWGSVPGRFMVRNAIQNWPAIVAQNAFMFAD